MLITVSSFKAPSGISMEASPKEINPPSFEVIRASAFSSFIIFAIGDSFLNSVL